MLISHGGILYSIIYSHISINMDYAYYLSQKNNLTIDEIDDIFDMLDNEKKVDFDKEYIEQLYLSYFESKRQSTEFIFNVKNIFKGKNVIMICPGKTSETHYNKLVIIKSRLCTEYQ